MESPSGLILEKQSARKDGEMAHESLDKYKYEPARVGSQKNGRGSAHLYLWTNPKNLPRNREILSRVERSEGKGGREPRAGGRAGVPSRHPIGSMQEKDGPSVGKYVDDQISGEA